MPADAVPKGLGARGRKLWRAATGEFELSVADATILEQAAAQLDTIDTLERLLAEQGSTVEGSRGQSRLNPLYAEIRQGRLAFAKLVDALSWPVDDADEGMTAAQRRAKHAADSRWARVRLLQGGGDDAAS